MAFLNCRRFLWCMPLRAGIWLLAFLNLLLGGAGAAGSWIEVKTTGQHKIPFIDQLALFAQAGIFSAMAAIALLGFISGVFGSRNGVFVYSRLAFLNFALSIFGLGVVLFSTLRPISAGDLSTCLADSEETFIVQFCKHEVSMLKILPIVFLAVSLPSLFYSFVIAINYIEKAVADEVDLWSAGWGQTSPVLDGRRPWEKLSG